MRLSPFHQLSHIASIILCFSLFAVLSTAAKVPITFGFLRMAAPGIDSPNTLAGYQALIRQANENNYYPQAHFVLNVTTIDCRNVNDCRNLTTYQQQQITTFLDAMTGYTAVLKPNYLLSTRIADRSLSLGGVPILDASDVEGRTFAKGSDHMINFGHNTSRSADHLFTYMQLKLNCAYSGILHGPPVPGLESNLNNLVNHIQKLFRDAGHSVPPHLDAQSATDAQLADFVMNDEPRRRCFLFLSTSSVLTSILERLAKLPAYRPRQFSYLAFPMTSADSFIINGTTNLTSRVTVAQWSPPDISPAVRNAFGVWKSSPLAVDLQAFATAETIPTTIEFFTVQASLVIRLAMEVISTVASQSFGLALCNTTNQSLLASGPPIPWVNITDGFYQGGRVIDGYKFASLVRTCPIQPQKQICYCNSLSQTSYIYEVNSTTGKLQVVYDDVDAGEREVASIEFPNFCGYEASTWSYPVTNVVAFPSSATGTSSLRADEIAAIVTFFRNIYRALTNDVNYATVKYPRSFRYVEISVDDGQMAETQFDQYLDGVNPFIILGSLADRINRSDVLTLVPSLMEIETEDPVLVSHANGWQWNVLQLEPSLADLIHGLVAYFADVMSDAPNGLRALNKKPKFTSIHALASTQREAELISMSFATWGYNVLVSDVVVSDSASVWAERTSSWLSNDQSSNPFVLVASAANPNSVILAAADAAAIANKGTTAMACSNAAVRSSSQTITFAPGSATNLSDVIFGSISDEFWMYDVNYFPESVQTYTKSPRFNLAYLSMAVATQLAQEVWYNFKTTAATILYAKGTITASTTALGPFSNTSCSRAQIASNTRDRTCQCTKGARSVYAHSLRAYVAGTYSDFTGRFSWTMSTCGVVYTPYVPPADDPSSLSSGAIAGIAIGGSVLLIAATAGYILSVCFLGRNNRNAPKDSTKPFAVVFTDIQSSTALWSRAPAAMSDAIEYHHELMRKTLRRNRGYEVKTVGDSFMIAFHEADDAVRFALEAQERFNEADWNQEIDAIYIELLAEAEQDEEEEHIKNATKDISTEGPPERSIIVPAIGSAVLLPTTPTHNIQTNYISFISDAGDKLEQSLNSQVAVGAGVTAQRSLFSLSAPAEANSQPLANRSGSSVQVKKGQMNLSITSHTVSVGIIDNDPRQLPYMAQPTSYFASRQKRDDTDNPDQSILSAHGLAGANYGRQQGYSSTTEMSRQKTIGANTKVGAVAEDSIVWHGLRVRIGVNFGMGDIRKDPITHGYDYYGTVVNTAARVEGVGHGGQTLVTEEAYNALSQNFAKKNDSVVIAMGSQPLRGLDAPVKLFQFLPSQLNLRKFPQLRLHIEKETEDTSTTNTGTATGTGTGSQTTDVETVDDMVAKLFASSKQFKMTSPDEVLYNHHFLTTIFAPVKEKFRNNVITKLAESWGFDKSAINAGMSNGNANKMRFLVSLVAKMTKTFVVGGRRSGNARDRRTMNRNPKETTIHVNGETKSVASDLSGDKRSLPKPQHFFLNSQQQGPLSPHQSQSNHPLSDTSIGAEPRSLV